MSPSFKRFALLLSFTAFLALSSLGCRHTANGAGKDIERAGEKIQNSTK